VWLGNDVSLVDSRVVQGTSIDNRPWSKSIWLVAKHLDDSCPRWCPQPHFDQSSTLEGLLKYLNCCALKFPKRPPCPSSVAQYCETADKTTGYVPGSTTQLRALEATATASSASVVLSTVTAANGQASTVLITVSDSHCRYYTNLDPDHFFYDLVRVPRNSDHVIKYCHSVFIRKPKSFYNYWCALGAAFILGVVANHPNMDRTLG